MRTQPILLLAGLLSGCASMLDRASMATPGMAGAGQTVSIETSPAGAACRISRNGETLGEVSSTPGIVHVGTGLSVLSVACSKPGYRTVTLAQGPRFNVAAFGNMSAAGLIRAGVDAASGANYTYPPDLHVALTADPVLAAAPPHTLAPQAAAYVTPANTSRP